MFRKVPQRRSSLEIIANILRIARKGARKTRIVYGANLNFKMLGEYLVELESKGLVTCSRHNGGLVTTTEKGKEVLRQFQEFLRLYQEGPNIA